MIEVVSQDCPDPRPFETNTVHIVISDVHKLLKGEQSGLGSRFGGLNLFPRNLAEASHEVHDSRLNCAVVSVIGI